MADLGNPRSSKTMTRRKWLIWSGSSVGLLGVGGGTLYAKQAGLVDAVGATLHTMRDHRIADLSGAVLGIAHGLSPEKNVRAALDAIGGMKRFVSSTDRVLIKPNIAWDKRPELGATTDPRVVAELVRACRDVGVENVRVLDCPVDDPNRTYQRTGILEAARAAGAKVLLPAESEYAYVNIAGYQLPWAIRDTFLWADKIINVPIAKHHGSAKVTAGMKNWIGVTDKGRSRFHASLNESIVALAELVRPTLTVIDATRILLRNGPRGGNLDDVQVTNTVVASTDPVAADAWACDLLGTARSKVPYLELAEKRGLGKADWKNVVHRELQLG